MPASHMELVNSWRVWSSKVPARAGGQAAHRFRASLAVVGPSSIAAGGQAGQAGVRGELTVGVVGLLLLRFCVDAGEEPLLETFHALDATGDADVVLRAGRQASAHGGRDGLGLGGARSEAQARPRGALAAPGAGHQEAPVPTPKRRPPEAATSATITTRHVRPPEYSATRSSAFEAAIVGGNLRQSSNQGSLQGKLLIGWRAERAAGRRVQRGELGKPVASLGLVPIELPQRA